MLNTGISIEQEIRFPVLEEKGIQLFVKRDDLIHPFISGNKWRKLKYNAKAFEDSGCQGILTFGGAFSNHIIATAAFCAQNKIECVGIIRGEKPGTPNPVLLLSQIWGMKMIFVSRQDYANKDRITADWEARGYFVIPEGGENEEGVRGCEEIVSELEGSYDHFFCASGTGCTVAGMVRGAQKMGLSTITHSIPVLKQGGFISERILGYVPGAQNFKVHTEYHGGGYAKAFPELLLFLKNFASETGILTDPVYTAKMFSAIFDLAKKGIFKKGERVLAVHTGGLTGLLSDKMLTAVQKIIP